MDEERKGEKGGFSVYDNDWHQQRASASTYLRGPTKLNVRRRWKGWNCGRDEEAKGTRKGAKRRRKQRVLYVKTISTIKITVGVLDNPRVNLEGL